MLQAIVLEQCSVGGHLEHALGHRQFRLALTAARAAGIEADLVLEVFSSATKGQRDQALERLRGALSANFEDEPRPVISPMAASLSVWEGALDEQPRTLEGDGQLRAGNPRGILRYLLALKDDEETNADDMRRAMLLNMHGWVGEPENLWHLLRLEMETSGDVRASCIDLIQLWISFLPKHFDVSLPNVNLSALGIRRPFRGVWIRENWGLRAKQRSSELAIAFMLSSRNVFPKDISRMIAKMIYLEFPFPNFEAPQFEPRHRDFFAFSAKEWALFFYHEDVANMQSMGELNHDFAIMFGSKEVGSLPIVNHFNSVCEKFSTLFLVLDTEKLQIPFLERCIEILSMLMRDFNDYNSSMAILCALTGSDISRTHLIKKISREHLMLKDEFFPILSPTKSFRELRSLVNQNREAGKSSIQYFGVYLTDLVFIADGHPIMTEGLINGPRVWLQGNILLEMNLERRELRNFDVDEYDPLIQLCYELLESRDEVWRHEESVRLCKARGYGRYREFEYK